MKRVLLILGRTFLYAYKNDMYGILFWYALVFAAVYTAIFETSFTKGAIGLAIVGASYLAIRFLLQKCIWIIGKGKHLERQIRHKEKLEGLKKYLFQER